MMKFAFFLPLALACFVALPPGLQAKDWHFLPNGAGEKSGAAWAHAADPARLQRVLDALQPGDRVLLGSGEYRDLKLVLTSSGVAEKPIAIQGEDRGTGLPVLVANWELAKPDKGPTAMLIAPGAKHGVIRDLVIRQYQHGIRAAAVPDGGEPRAGWRFENVDMDHIRHGFYLSGFNDLRLSDCDLRRYSKHGFRWEAACSQVVVERCTADCSEGDRAWEEQTESFPFGFTVNNGGAPSRDIVFDGCVARNNLMPLQKTRYKNGDGFVVEGNSENVAFRRCRSVRNQDGGFDLKVEDVRLEDCVAIGNKRNFRIWTTGHLSNCYSGWGNEGIWTKGGALVAEHCTIAGWKNRPVSTEEAQAGVELRKCLLAADGGKAESMQAVKLLDCVQTPDLASAGLVRLPENWAGEAAELATSKHPGHGYRPR